MFTGQILDGCLKRQLTVDSMCGASKERILAWSEQSGDGGNDEDLEDGSDPEIYGTGTSSSEFLSAQNFSGCAPGLATSRSEVDGGREETHFSSILDNVSLRVSESSGFDLKNDPSDPFHADWPYWNESAALECPEL
jgi:hypothetical protein